MWHILFCQDLLCSLVGLVFINLIFMISSFVRPDILYWMGLLSEQALQYMVTPFPLLCPTSSVTHLPFCNVILFNHDDGVLPMYQCCVRSTTWGALLTSTKWWLRGPRGWSLQSREKSVIAHTMPALVGRRAGQLNVFRRRRRRRCLPEEITLQLKLEV